MTPKKCQNLKFLAFWLILIFCDSKHKEGSGFVTQNILEIKIPLGNGKMKPKHVKIIMFSAFWLILIFFPSKRREVSGFVKPNILKFKNPLGNH